MQHFLDLFDWTGDQIHKLLKDAAKLKAAQQRGKIKPTLQGRVLGLVFEKPSLRTRASFEAAMAHLGGASIFISQSDAGLGKRESIADFARTISQFVDAVVLIGTTTHSRRFVRCFEITTQGRFSITSGGRNPMEKSHTSTVPSTGEKVIARGFDQTSTSQIAQ